MKNTQFFRGFLVAVAAVGIGLPSATWAAESAAKPAVVDVALRDGGVLVGQVVNPQGAAMEGAPVTLRYQNENVVTTKTGKEGYFAVKGVRGGTHEIVTTSGHGIYRLWAAGTAPPAAQPGALVVAGQDVTLGQQCPPDGNAGTASGLKRFLTNPLVIGGVVATAIAVPIAVSNNHHHSPN